ncbi:MAG: sigma-70 family RNA polymerase sigma factor [Acidobacteria bacterium]|nr:sigma-70 family RNA polymerase sigma factor [Acidobacteriota bacterium]
MTRLPPRGGRASLEAVPDPSALAAAVKALLDAGRRDEAAERFGLLVGAWQRRALRLALHYLGNPADADDAVQDAFVKLYAHMTAYRADLSFDAWFSRIVVNTCLDHLKARRRLPAWSAGLQTSASDIAEALPSHEPSAERRLLARDRWSALSAAVGQLPERQREVFVLTHLDEQPPQAIAAALGMNPATVRVHLFRALRRLRSVLGDRS